MAVDAKVDINAASNPASNKPHTPTGTNWLIAFGRINSKSIAPVFVVRSRSLKKARARIVKPMIIR